MRPERCGALLVLVLTAGCRQDMHDQPKYEPLEASAFFADGQASRPLVEGTVARGQLREDERLYTGKVDGQPVDDVPVPITARSARARPASATTSTARLPRPDRRRPRHGRRSAATGSRRRSTSTGCARRRPATSSTSSPTASARCPTTRADPARRPLGDRRLHPRAAAQPARHGHRPEPREREEMTIPSDRAEHFQRSALVVGAAAALVSILGGFAFAGAEQFFRSYLAAFMLWLGVALGSLAILMLHHLTGGAWGLVIRRLLEAATRTLPFLALLFCRSSARCRCSTSGRGPTWLPPIRCSRPSAST